MGNCTNTCIKYNHSRPTNPKNFKLHCGNSIALEMVSRLYPLHLIKCSQTIIIIKNIHNELRHKGQCAKLQQLNSRQHIPKSNTARPASGNFLMLHLLILKA